MAFYRALERYKNDKDYPNKQAWIAARLLTLRHDLNETIKKDRQANSLIIGSWNIRAFDDGIPRMDESYHYLAEIIDHFDICAIQEVKIFATSPLFTSVAGMICGSIKGAPNRLHSIQ